MLEMTSDAPTKGGKLPDVITHNVIWDNQKNESFAYRWLRILAMCDITGFPAIVGASDVNSSVHLIR